MSDEEILIGSGSGGGGAGGGIGDDEVNLPKATIYKIITDYLKELNRASPGTSSTLQYTIAKDTRDIISDCAIEFVHLLASESNEICEKEGRKTISPEHVIEALDSLGFKSYLADCRQLNKEQKVLAVKDKDRKCSSKQEQSGMTQEELIAAQEALFASSRAALD